MSPKQTYTRLTILCTVVYFTSYVSRVNLAAVMVELIQTGFAEKHTAALALTVGSITYGIGQVLSGILGDRFKPQNIIFLGFLLTASMNAGVAFLEASSLLPVLWAINGFAQACMWPPLQAILTTRLSEKEYSRACTWVIQGGAFGTIFVYSCSPLLILLGGFRVVFGFCGAAALVTGLIWKIFYGRWFKTETTCITQTGFKEAAVTTESFGRHALTLIALIMLANVLQGALRDGVTNWMPTFVSESFRIDGSSAILAGVLLPIFQIPCTEVAARLQHKHLSNETTVASLCFAIGAASSVLLSVVMGHSVLLTTLLMALLVGCMHGVNFMLISIAPRQFRRFGHISLASGVLNCSTYVGSALSTYGIAALSESMGWQGTSLMWAGIAAAGAVLCLSMSKRWRHFRRS